MWKSGQNLEWNLLAQTEKSSTRVGSRIKFPQLMAAVAVVSVTILVPLEHSRRVDAVGTTQCPQFTPVVSLWNFIFLSCLTAKSHWDRSTHKAYSWRRWPCSFPHSDIRCDTSRKSANPPCLLQHGKPRATSISRASVNPVYLKLPSICLQQGFSPGSLPQWTPKTLCKTQSIPDLLNASVPGKHDSTGIQKPWWQHPSLSHTLFFFMCVFMELGREDWGISTFFKIIITITVWCVCLVYVCVGEGCVPAHVR